MSDITKCLGGQCPNKDKCYRYTSEAGPRQSYFVSLPMKSDEYGKFVFCVYYVRFEDQ